MSQKAVETKKQTPKQPATPDPALKRLDVFVGKWNTEWRTKESSSDASFKTIGTDTYEWLEGGFFLIHNVDVRMDDGDYKVIEIIGHDASNQTYPMRSFDSQGNSHTFKASVNAEGVWTLEGKTMRATIKVGEDGNTKTAEWERSSDGVNWQPWMDMRFTKAT